MENLYGDLGMPAFGRSSQQACAPVSESAPAAKRAAKPKQERPAVIPLSLDIEDVAVFRTRWDHEITKECSAAEAADLKLTAEDRSSLGISVCTPD